MVKLKTTNTKLDEIAVSLNKKQLFSDDNVAYIYRITFRPSDVNNLKFIRLGDIDLLKVSNTKINSDIKYETVLNTSYTSGGTFISCKESTVDQYMYAFINISDKSFAITKKCTEECNEYNESHLDIYYDSDKYIFVVNTRKDIHIVSSSNKYIDETIALTSEDNSFSFKDPSKYYTLFVVFNNNFNIDTVKVFNKEINLEDCFYDLISDFDTGRDDIVFSTVGKKVDMKRIETTESNNSNMSIRSNRDLVYEKYNGLENFIEIGNIEFPDGTYLMKDTEDDIRIDDPDYYFPMVMYGNNIGRYTQEYLNPGNDNYYNNSDIKRILLDTPEGDKVSKNILKISEIITDVCYNIILQDLGGYLGITLGLGNDDGYDKHYLEVIKDAYEQFHMFVLSEVANYINRLFKENDSVRYHADSFESDSEDTKVYDFSNLNNIRHKAINIKKLVYTDKIFMNEDESAGIDILNLIIEYTYNGNVYLYNITAMYSNVNNAIMNININCSVNKKDSFAINLNQIDKCNLLCYSYINNSNDIAEEVPISARMLKYTESGLSKTFIYDIYPSGDSYSDIFDKIDYPVYSAFSAGIRIK
jgi:hypothetical protein